MQDIHRVTFPLPLAFGVRGGPYRHTEIATSVSGYEQRNSPRASSRRKYDVGAGVQSLADLETLTQFFEARMGQLYGFLFRDPLDYLSCPAGQTPSATDQFIATADGTATQFALKKHYGDSAATRVRRIRFPKSRGFTAAINGTEHTATLNFDTGHFSFTSPPEAGAEITAGFEFLTPVRFDMAHLDISLEAFGAGQAVSIPLIELTCHDDA